MKVLIQRVNEASVEIEQKIHAKIKKGLLLFVCFEENDGKEQIKKAALKVRKLRIFEDLKNKMNLDIKDVEGSILSISQFTLSWDGAKGHRPSFDKSLHPAQARLLYREFNDHLKSFELDVKEGIFAAEMKVRLENDGPVTFMLNF